MSEKNWNPDIAATKTYMGKINSSMESSDEIIVLNTFDFNCTSTYANIAFFNMLTSSKIYFSWVKSYINTFSPFVKSSIVLSYMLASAEKINKFKLNSDVFLYQWIYASTLETINNPEILLTKNIIKCVIIKFVFNNVFFLSK